MGLFAYAVAGGGGILIGVWESVSSAAEAAAKGSQLVDSLPQTVSRDKPKVALFSSGTTYLFVSALAALFVVNSLISLSDAVVSKDNIGFALQLQVIAIALLFLLNSLLGFFSNTIDSFRFPEKLLSLMDAFAFGEEFLLFYAHVKDPGGVENRYYNLILVPIAICLFSTLLGMRAQKSAYPRLGRGIGIILQGMWTVQMGFSFFTKMISNECALDQKSRGNFTITCQGHPEYHRGSAIATLLFNCHLAALVTLSVGFYGVCCKIKGVGRETAKYEPIEGALQRDDHGKFTLESSDDDGDGGDRIEGERSLELQAVRVAASSETSHGSPPPVLSW